MPMSSQRIIRLADRSSCPIPAEPTQHNVIENLKRAHGLPRVHLCGKAVYPTDAVKQWLQQRVTCGR